MAKDRINKHGVVITEAEYQAYQKLRRNRAKRNRQVKDLFSDVLNKTYANDMYTRTSKEKKGKRYTINDIRSRYEFEEILRSGQKYIDFDRYKQLKTRDYMYNMRQAFYELSGKNEEIVARYDEIISSLDDMYKLEDIYANTEELDLSFIYVETAEQGIDRLNNALDILEKEIQKANEEI